MTRKILASIIFVAIVGGAMAASRKTDADMVLGVLPEREQVAGPLAKVHFGALTNVDERVRARIRTDAGLEGAKITVSAKDGIVKLSGKAESSVQRERAVQMAQTTTGVTKVDQEIAVPEGK